MPSNFPELMHFPLTSFHSLLFSWWRAHGRILPWREKLPVLSSPRPSRQRRAELPKAPLAVREQHFDEYFASSLQRDPYKVVVAEMMLQQTQVERVLPKYHEWLQKWPTTTALASSNMSEVLILWQGLGYNRRAKFLWQLAKAITNEHQGVWPTTEAELLKLPGIGKYTARAVMSFALGEQVGVVDTNILRVLGRVLVGIPITLPTLTTREAFELADQVLPIGQADPWNQGIMDLGALICTARSPKCAECPVQIICQANLEAQELGFVNFAEWLKANSAVTGRSKKLQPKFEETNRFFRGRIMDELRVQSPRNLPAFYVELEKNYGLKVTRAQELLMQLAKEELVTLRGQKVELGN